jgi:hypothetical protein
MEEPDELKPSKRGSVIRWTVTRHSLGLEFVRTSSGIITIRPTAPRNISTWTALLVNSCPVRRRGGTQIVTALGESRVIHITQSED